MDKKRKIAAISGILLFIVLLIPIISLSSVNRATGDDYNYGIYTRDAWVHTHSLAKVGKAACRTISQNYYSHQGTWFSLFLFSIQPEVFHDKAYFITAPIMLFLWIGSTFYLFKQILYKKIGTDKWYYCLITVCFLIISIEFIPHTPSAIYWFNGCTHYIVPFSMCQMMTGWLFRYMDTYKKKYLFGITVFMALLGGSNYQAALFSLIVTCYMMLFALFYKKEKRILTLLFPLFLETAGLIVSMAAPGNSVRTAAEAYEEGAEFGFSFTNAVITIGKSFLYALKDILIYIEERPLIFVGLFFLFLIFTISFCTGKDVFKFKHPLWITAMLFCLYSAMQAPAIYAGVPVSGGVPNTNFLVFLLTAAGILLLIAEKTAARLRALRDRNATKKVLQIIVIPGILVCLICAFFLRSGIKNCTSYAALRYIASGEAADFKQQMDLQTKLMEKTDTEDVIVPFINDVQGPLMHMPVTDDPHSFTSWATAEFYGKNSVIAIDRNEWIELYGTETH